MIRLSFCYAFKRFVSQFVTERHHAYLSSQYTQAQFILSLWNDRRANDIQIKMMNFDLRKDVGFLTEKVENSYEVDRKFNCCQISVFISLFLTRTYRPYSKKLHREFRKIEVKTHFTSVM